MEVVGIDPTQAYLCAGVLQTLELSIAQRPHKSFSKITRQCRLYDSNGYIRKTKRCPSTPTVCDSLDQCEFLVTVDGTAPSPLASKTSTLLLRYTEKFLVPRDGYAPSSDDYQSSVFLLNYPGKNS